jgi:DNA-binding NtrC family response regulator
MSANYRFLLVGTANNGWLRVLDKAVSDLGSLNVVSEDQAVESVLRDRYDVVVIDAGAIDDAWKLTSRLRTSRPETRVVVATLSRTWRRARQAMHAGASDYIYKTTNTGRLRSTLEEVVSCPPPRWPR